MMRRWWYVAPTALAVVAFTPAPAPFAWGAAALALVAFRLVFLLPEGVARGLSVAAGSAALTLALAESLLPGPPVPPEACEHTDLQRPDTEDPLHGVLGIGPPSGTVLAAEQMAGNVGYRGVYTMDEHGLRQGFPSSARDAVLFFGCSYMFGLNVADEETIPYLVGRALAGDYACHNFGYVAYGPQQMLAALESGMVDDVVQGTPRHVFYQLIDSHVRRVVGKGWWMHAPRYEIDEEGGVVHRGRLCDPAPERGLLARLLDRSALFRKVAAHTRPGDVDLLLAVLETSRDRFRERYPGCTFQVILWDKRSWKSRRMLAGLRAAGIRVHLVSEILPGLDEDYDSWFLSGDDHHPTPEAQALLAERVIASLRADG